jgi:hypothetical protein
VVVVRRGGEAGVWQQAANWWLSHGLAAAGWAGLLLVAGGGLGPSKQQKNIPLTIGLGWQSYSLSCHVPMNQGQGKVFSVLLLMRLKTMLKAYLQRHGLHGYVSGDCNTL